MKLPGVRHQSWIPGVSAGENGPPSDGRVGGLWFSRLQPWAVGRHIMPAGGQATLEGC